MAADDGVETFHASNRTPRQLLTIVAGVLMIAGCFMPWASIFSIRIVGTDSSDWWLFAALGGITAVLQFDKVERGFAQVLLGTTALLLWAYEYTQYSKARGDVALLAADIDQKVGVGLWLILASALTTTGTAVAMLLAEHRHPAEPAPAPDPL